MVHIRRFLEARPVGDHRGAGGNGVDPAARTGSWRAAAVDVLERPFDGGTAGHSGDRARAGVPFGPVGGAFGAIGVAVLAMLVLHMRGTGRLDPAATTVSDYVSLPGGSALLVLATLAIATATAIVGVLLWRRTRALGATGLFGLGCAGLLASIAFPTKAMGAAVTVDTVLHRYAAGLFFVSLPDRYAAGLFFVSLPVAALCTLRHLPSPAVAWLTALSVLAGIAFLISHLPLVLPESPGAHLVATVLPRGIAERVLLAADLVLLAGLARRVAR